MKFWQKLVGIGWIFVLALSYVVFLIRPTFDIFQFGKSLIFRHQRLPLEKMVVSPHQGNVYQIEKGKDGFVVVGPYLTLPAGRWKVNFEIVPACENSPIGYIDVSRKKGRVLEASKEIMAQKNGSPQIETLEFEGPLNDSYEFRLSSNGQCGFLIKRAWLERLEVFPITLKPGILKPYEK